MIGLSDVSTALGNVSNALGGGVAPTPAAAGDPHYLRGVHIDQEDEEVGGATAPNLVNDRDTHPQTEFIHFGNVHTSYGNLFPHDNYKDNATITPDLSPKARPRAVQFRSALEREAILLSVFIESAQSVLAERESVGSLGSLASAAGSLLGGAAGGVKSSELNAPLLKGISAAGTVNVASVQYHDTHQAGMDYHQARTDYRALLKKLVDEPPKPSPGAGLLAALPGTGSVAGPVAGLVTFTQGAVFKAADIKIKCFALVASQQERQIELACHAMTMSAITNRAIPFLPVWCPVPEEKGRLAQVADLAKQAAAKKNLADAFNSAIGDPLGLGSPGQPSDGGDDDGEKKGFLEVDPPETQPEGTPFMEMAFAVPEPSANPADPVPMEMGKLTCLSFTKAIGQTSLPSFVETIVTDIDTTASDFVAAVYKVLLIRSQNEAIEKDSLVLSAIDQIGLVDKLKALTIDRLTFLQQAENANFSAMGYSVNPGDLVAQGNQKIKDLFDNKMAPIVTKAIGTAMDEMANQLELARQDSASTKSYTMEWYLGRLPWVRVSLFYNLFFPFWSALMRCVVELVGGPAGAALKALVDASDKLKSAADSAKAEVDKVQAAKDQLGQGMNLLDPTQIANLGKAKSGAQVLTQGLAPSVPILRGRFKLPFTGRLPDGQGMDITDYDTVKTKHQWDKAIDPNAPANAPDDTAAPPPVS